MLNEVLDVLHNHFEVSTHYGEYEILGGTLFLDNIADGQYFRIIGSVFNDGVYEYPCYELTDEMFTGTVQLLAIPKELIELVEQIKQYIEKNPENTPFVSESWNGYSYTKSTGSNGAVIGWQTVFAKRLNRWRKI